MQVTELDRLEQELAGLSAVLTDPHDRECLFCYVYRMLEFHCRCDLRWATRWRDLRAPRATALVRRLNARGGFCDCEIFMNGWRPRIPAPAGPGRRDRSGWSGSPEPDYPEPDYPEQMPPCPGVRPGSTKPCLLWVPKPRQRLR